MNVTCPISNECGGCSQIGLPYEQQLAVKQQRIEELFAPLLARGVSSGNDLGKADSATATATATASASAALVVQPILGMEDPRAYRNKIVSPFAPAPASRKRSLRSMAHTGRAGRVALRREDIQCGLYAAGTHKIIACESCPVEHPVGRRVVAAVRQIMARYGMAPYNEDAGTGFVRHVVVRVGANGGEVLVTLVTNGRDFTGSKNFCKELVRAVPEVTTIVQNVNTSATNAILGQEDRVLYGPGFILDTLCGLSFRISSHSFFQVNALQTQVLYSAALASSGILDAAASAGTQSASALADSRTEVRFVGANEAISGTSEILADTSTASESNDSPAYVRSKPLTILDAYCGTGTIGLVAAAAAPGAQVIGVDSVEAAIADARQNAAHNGIENARFVAQDAGEFMQGYAALGETVDVVFMDPPRAGATPEFLQALLKLSPKRIVYISCNPETPVRDARVLQEGGYQLQSIQPVDMFPHTQHVECVALMSCTDV